MRRKVWTSSPLFIIFSAVMLGMALVSYRFSYILSVVEATIAVASMLVVVLFAVSFKRYINRTIASAISNISEVNQSYLERFKMPVVVAGRFGDILWSNSRFKKQLCLGRNPVNDNISEYIGSRSIEDVADSEGFDIDLDGKHYTVFCTNASDGYICFYIDNTYYKETVKKYNDTRKSVALVVFDNREEFSGDSEEESVRVILSLEEKLLRFAHENNALFKSLPSNKYMLIFDKLHLEKQIKDKFPILKEIRSIRYNNREATISVGIGADCDTLIDSEQKARKALDMALGRGGDQVAVMHDDNYEFFGGISTGIERMSKVRSRVIATSIARAVSESDKVLIMGHRFSDLDCVGAAVGLQPVIEKSCKKHCRIVLNKETSMAQSLIDLVEESGQNMFITPEDALKGISSKTLLIVVDTHIPDVVESPEVLKKSKRIIVVDHHRKMVNFIDNSIVFYHEPIASSASEMITELITYLGENFVDKLQAEALLAGIMLDTKNFVIRTGVRTFEAAAFLRKRGADTVETKALFAGSLDTYREKFEIVSKAEIIDGCAVVIADSETRDIRLVAAQAADELLTVSKVVASFVIFKSNDVINISARSYGKMNVQVIMEALGGGGHQNMAAVQLENTTPEEAKAKLIETLNNTSV
ncbi:MAG: DHH family phosphoesterase [Ruminococcus sp.]|nr:DHH family phosphoesterase [Ruminococcus sp.]